MAQSGQSGQRFYTFGPFRLDPNERVLFHTDRPVPLTPKARDLLLVLVERHGHIVDKNDLMRIVWPDAFVEENNLTQNVSVLRKVLGESVDGREYIETIPKRGYRFAAKVTEVHEATTSAGREVSAESLAAREADDANGDRRSDSALTIAAPAADFCLPPSRCRSMNKESGLVSGLDVRRCSRS